MSENPYRDHLFVRGLSQASTQRAEKAWDEGYEAALDVVRPLILRSVATAIREDADDEYAQAISDAISVWLEEDELAAVRANFAESLERLAVGDTTTGTAGETPTSATPDR